MEIKIHKEIFVNEMFHIALHRCASRRLSGPKTQFVAFNIWVKLKVRLSSVPDKMVTKTLKKANGGRLVSFVTNSAAQHYAESQTRDIIELALTSRAVAMHVQHSTCRAFYDFNPLYLPILQRTFVTLSLGRPYRIHN